MLRLMKLELRQNRLKPYIFGTLVITFVLILLTYSFALLPRLPADNDLENMVMELVGQLFGNYQNIISIICILSMFCFSVLSSTMLSKLVIADYTGKRANLLFSYPFDRRLVFMAKIQLVSLFTVVAMLFCNSLVFGVFFIAESIYSLISGNGLNAVLIIDTLKATMIFAVISVAIGLISLFFGFDKKSVPAMMIPTYILATIFSNVFGSTMLISKSLKHSFLHIVLAAIALVIGLQLIARLAQKVNGMEAV